MEEIIKRCGNHLCSKLMYEGQYGYENEYCDDDCRQEVIHWNSITKDEKNPTFGGFISEAPSQYPHRLYPDTILDIDAEDYLL